jgi:hypothetical protein
MLSEILCLLPLRNLLALVLESCVRGLHSIFGPPTNKEDDPAPLHLTAKCLQTGPSH